MYNRTALKKLSELHIDYQVVHPLGVKIFSQEHTNSEILEFSNCLDDILESVTTIKSLISKINEIEHDGR